MDGWLPEKFRIIGTGHQHMEEEAFHSHLKAGVDKYARRTLTEEAGAASPTHLTFMTADLEKPEVFGELARKLADQDREWNDKANRIFYLSLPPTMIEPVARNWPGRSSTRTASGTASWWRSLSAATWTRPGP